MTKAIGSVLFFAFLRALWLLPLLEVARVAWMPRLADPVFGFSVVFLLPVGSEAITRFLTEGGERGERSSSELPVVNNIKLVIFGQCTVLFVLWHRFYLGDYVVFDPGWLQVLALRLVEGGKAAFEAWFAAAVATFLWVAGMADAFRSFTHHRVASTLRVGLVSFVFQALTLRLEGMDHAPMLTASVVAFFGLCALALALASTQVAGGLSVPLGARSPRTVLRMRLGWAWLSTTGGSVVAVLALGLLAATLVSARAIEMVVSGWHLVIRATLHGALALATFVDTVVLPWLHRARTIRPPPTGSSLRGMHRSKGASPRSATFRSRTRDSRSVWSSSWPLWPWWHSV